ncbi:toxin [bacterium]|nr:MAG: toxin [bacterium]
MALLFIEARGFTSAVTEYFGDDEAYRRFQNDLAKNPEAGPVMTGTGHFRKLRWSDPGRGKGKRGGIRVVYIHIREIDTVFLADVYSKDEKDDLAPEAKRRLKTLCAERIEDLKRLYERAR